MSTSKKTTPVSPLSGANFDPFATHPFTSYSPPAPCAPPPPRNPAPTHSHNTMTSRLPSSTHSKPPKLSPTAGTPPIVPVFAPYRPEAAPPDLSQVLKKQPSGWKLPGQ
ncbi:hypothetical protein K438DRAFT_2120967 [Mycena galopus ATCC 62051]|nr:hypothetical protein K438DRAFT_2120967 [Mycena galopus ATCC 62051]